MAGKKTTAKAPADTKPKETEKAQEQKSKIPSLYAKIDRLVDYEGSKVKAFASVTIGNAFAVHGIRIVESEKGPFVAMPSSSYQKDGKTEYNDIFHPITGDARTELNNHILEAYEQKLQEEQAESETQDMDEEAPALGQSM